MGGPSRETARGAGGESEKQVKEEAVMTIFLLWVLVGLIAGWLAGFVVKAGGYGLTGDMLLGLVGSIVGSWIFGFLGFSPGAGPLALVVVAFIGATIAIAAQRQFWTARA